jgi:hypothetical protein
MGIKFRCPSGHKLNVKSFLAGKKGVCPKCGVSLRIPDASEADLEDSGVGQFDAPAVDLPVAPAPSPAVAAPTAAAVGVPVGTAMAGRPVAPGPSAPVGPAETAMSMPSPVRPQPTHPGMMPTTPQPAMPQPGVMPQPGYGYASPAPAAYGPADPISEAPAATWYVRPPAGSQYGPARGDVMRKWIAEGRVSGDSLVWREGWTDWRNAGQVFPNLTAAGATTGALAQPTSSVFPSPASTARPAPRPKPRQKGGTGMAVAFLVLLALACVVLVGVLVYVLSTQAAA